MRYPASRVCGLSPATDAYAHNWLVEFAEFLKSRADGAMKPARAGHPWNDEWWNYEAGLNSLAASWSAEVATEMSERASKTRSTEILRTP